MPGTRSFKPAGVPMRVLEEIVMSVDELESVRLADYLGLYQEQAADKMRISRPTFGRIIESAHRKIADALVNGRALRIEGGTIEMHESGEAVNGIGASGSCICPKCSEKVPHEPGIPCKEERCPRCGTGMIREGPACHGRLMEKRNKEKRRRQV